MDPAAATKRCRTAIKWTTWWTIVFTTRTATIVTTTGRCLPRERSGSLEFLRKPDEVAASRSKLPRKHADRSAFGLYGAA